MIEESSVQQNNMGKSRRKDAMQKAWFRFSRNKLSVVGLVIVLLVILSAVFAPYITPYPEHSGSYVDLMNANQAPSSVHIFGTDTVGRDVFTRIVFSFRGALKMAALVLVIAVPFGSMMGLLAGFAKGSWIDTVIMRLTDIFLSVPSLILAMAIAAILEPNLTNSMLAITVTWWPWYARITYNIASSTRNEYYVINAELIGESKIKVLLKQILPNCYSTVFTKMALDVGWVVLNGASLSFLGMGEQAPIPSLGGMISDGYSYMPELWWLTVFPALAIIFIIVGFNFLGDGVGDMLAKGDKA